MTKSNSNPVVITGKWPDGKTTEDFFKSLDLDPTAKKAFQLYQTWSTCSLEKFSAETILDPAQVDQYRAFCSDWELWVRNINARELRFRLTGAVFIDEKRIYAAGFVLAENALENTHIEKGIYPLWGKSLRADSLTGWYTQEIPQIIQYPVDVKWEQVAVETKNYIGADGTINMVCLTSLVEFKENQSPSGGE